MARTQSNIVHEGVSYDFDVDTSHMSALECANLIMRGMNL